VRVDRRAPAGDDALGWILDETWAVKVGDYRRAAEVVAADGAANGEAADEAADGPDSAVVPIGVLDCAG